MQCGRHETTWLRDQLPAADTFAGLDHSLGRHADVLSERHHVVPDERHALYRQVFGLFFQMGRMHTVLEAATQLAE